MKKILALLIILFFIISCNKQNLDIASIDFNKSIDDDLDKLNISRVDKQNGHFELIKNENKVEPKLIADGNICTTYILAKLSDENKIYYSGIAIEPNSGGRIIVNNKKIVFVNIALKPQETFNVLKKLKTTLGKPDQVIYDSIADNSTENKVKLILKGFPKNEIKHNKDDFFSYLIFPLRYVWLKDNYIYEYTFLTGDKVFDNELVILSKKAFKEKIIPLYYNPENDPILSKYIK